MAAEGQSVTHMTRGQMPMRSITNIDNEVDAIHPQEPEEYDPERVISALRHELKKSQEHLRSVEEAAAADKEGLTQKCAAVETEALNLVKQYTAKKKAWQQKIRILEQELRNAQSKERVLELEAELADERRLRIRAQNLADELAEKVLRLSHNGDKPSVGEGSTQRFHSRPRSQPPDSPSPFGATAAAAAAAISTSCAPATVEPRTASGRNPSPPAAAHGESSGSSTLSYSPELPKSDPNTANKNMSIEDAEDAISKMLATMISTTNTQSPSTTVSKQVLRPGAQEGELRGGDSATEKQQKGPSEVEAGIQERISETSSRTGAVVGLSRSVEKQQTQLTKVEEEVLKEVVNIRAHQHDTSKDGDGDHESPRSQSPSSTKHNILSTRGCADPKTKGRARIALALAHACLAGKQLRTQRNEALAELAKVEDSNRRAMILLKDDPDGHRPYFRGLYVEETKTTSSSHVSGVGPDHTEPDQATPKVLMKIYGTGPKQFSLSEATSFYSWSDVERRFVKVACAPASSLTSTKRKSENGNRNLDGDEKENCGVHRSHQSEKGADCPPSKTYSSGQPVIGKFVGAQKQSHHRNFGVDDSLGGTIIALGFNPISKKFLRKEQEQTSRSGVPSFQLFEPAMKF